MPVSLSKLTNATDDLAIPLGDDGDVLNVTYRTNAITPKYLARYENEKSVAGFVSAIKELVVSWDLLDDEGAVVPIDDGLSELGIHILSALYEKIVQAARPLSKSKKIAKTL